MKLRSCLGAVVGLAGLGLSAVMAGPYPEKTPDTFGNRMLDKYFARQVDEVEATGGVSTIKTAEEWKEKSAIYRKQLGEMLGLNPLPERTALKATKTGELKGDGYVVEKMHYQAMPGLYVTANLYLPEKVGQPLPTILYVCGHAVVEKDGITFGNKTGYHHHGVWFARHGYVCMIIDTVELGEIRGEHHGTFNKGRWWWYSRGYTPVGLETWASMRGLDYLETRPEVDKTRFGITGRSGGGAYSWYTAAFDERIKVAAPTAGITSMRDHVVGGCVEGHCDCMFHVNTYRWDFDRVAALMAPRALLVCNTDKDPIFPVGGVFKVYEGARKIYSLLGVEGNIGLQIAEGGHLDVQPLNTGAFHWFERFLKKANIMQVIDEGAKKTLKPEDLRVFKELPKDEINTTADEVFVPLAVKPAVPASKEAWVKQRDAWMAALNHHVFRNWPKDAASVKVSKGSSEAKDGVSVTAYEFESEAFVPLQLFVAHAADLKAEDMKLVVLNVLDADGWKDFGKTYGSRFGKVLGVDQVPAVDADEKAFTSVQGMFKNNKWAMVYLCPRGVGATEWTGSPKAQTQRLRRYYLLGQTLDSMRVWDVRRGVQAIRKVEGIGKAPLWINAGGDMAVNALYASLYESEIARLDLHEMPTTHMKGPAYLNVLKHLDIPQVAAMAAERSRIALYAKDKESWAFVKDVTKVLGLPEKHFQLREPVTEEK